MMTYISLGLLLFAMSAWLVRYFIKIANKFNIIDIPNSRSSHKLPVARGGGIIICLLVGVLIAALYLTGNLASNVAIALGCSCIMSIVGFLDDIIKLTIKFRLLMQLLVSALAVVLVMPLAQPIGILSIVGLITAVGFLIWSTNLFNFMDGIDGLAAMEAIVVLSVAAGVLFVTTKDPVFSGLLWGISCITMGFLYFNLPPAKIFMGDAGSYLLGFLIAISAIISHCIYKVSIVFWLIIYAAFLFDATITLLRRFLLGEQWYLPHRSHAYQRLQNIGWQHRDILFGLIIINVLLGSLVIVGYYYQLLLAAVVTLILLTIIYFSINWSIKANEKNI